MRLFDLGARVGATLRTSAALGLRPLAAPVTVFIPLGVVLGPQVSGVLSVNALARLDIVVSIALATLGVLIGLAAGRESAPALDGPWSGVPVVGARSSARRLLAASSVEACLTVLVVAAAILFLLKAWRVPIPMPDVLVALALGVCASASAAPAVTAGAGAPLRVAAMVADLDDVVPILLGAVVLILVSPASSPVTARVALTIVLGLAVGTAGWLLLERAEGAERGVFVLGTLALLGGAPAYLGLSPLLAGLTAGWLWVIAPGGTDRLITGELRKVQHPLVVLLLITAGASLAPTLAGVWLFAPYVVFRFAGKLVGGWAASRIAPGIAPADLGAYLITPGVIGIAFALNLQQVAPDGTTALVFAVAAGAVACEVLAVAVMPEPRTV